MRKSFMIALGIDIGGSGIKGALVDTARGEMITDRYRISTPRPATPKAVIGTVNKILRHFDYQGPLGIGFPGIIVDGVTLSAVNIHKDWQKYKGEKAIAKATGCETVLRNDADVAGFAEMRYGAGRDATGETMIFTLGTGIGSTMFVKGRCVPNLELGHLYLLSWRDWGKRLNEYFNHIEFLFSPQRIIIGGGVSKKAEKFLKYIKVRADVVAAELRNEAGIIGAAAMAEVGGDCTV
jgi:polyphosphate glucokinase